MGVQASTPPDRKVLLFVGPGGVGKTTTAAAFAIARAAGGARVLVVTIDPSRRLAQALGLDADHGARAGRIAAVPLPHTPSGDAPAGSLEALLLDSREVFDEIVGSCARTPDAAASLLKNPIYKATAERLGGALEYAAMARLQMLHASGHYDLIVLDTPPTANALEFMAAPRKIRELIDNPAGRILLGGSRIGGTLLGLGARVFVRALSTLGGAEFISQLGEFLRDFSDVIAQFHQRGGDFERLLTSADTGVYLTTSPAPFSVREAITFLGTLVDQGLAIDGVVLNRVHPEAPAAPAGAPGSNPASPPQSRDRAIEACLDKVREAAAELARQRRMAVTTLRETYPSLRILEVETVDPAPEGVEALRAVGEALT